MSSNISLKIEKRKAGDTAKFVLPLEVLESDYFLLAGGKAVNLGELIHAGFLTPQGFVVTTLAYDCFMEQNRLGTILAQVVNDKMDGSVIRSAIERAHVPEDVEQAILDAYHEMGRGSVAVRSSATAEDLLGESFAGQMDTFLDISGDAELVEAVRRCWASLWSARAISYRGRSSFSHEKVKMAVIVQRMVPAEIAGVLFTANPVTGARDEMVINASPGLGEAVVSGISFPDHFVIRHRLWGWAVTVKRRSKRVDIAGSSNDAQFATSKNTLTLEDEELKKLAALGKTIERHFGSPQDVEWAIAEGKIYIIQARPMTAIPGPPFHPSWLQRIAASILAEFFPIRPYPLEITTWTPVPFKSFSAMIKPTGMQLPSFEDIFTLEDSVVVAYRGRVNPKLTPGIILAPCRLLGLALRYDPVRWREDPLLAKAISVPAELAKRNLKELDWQALLSTVRDSISIITPFLGELRRRYGPRAALAIVCLRMAVTILGQGKRFAALLYGVQTKTLETNQILNELAEQVKLNPALAGVFKKHEVQELPGVLQAMSQGRDFLSRFDAFLDCYGHRETGSLLLVYPPTWKDSPEVVLSIIKELAEIEPVSKSERQSWEKTRDELLRHHILRLPPLRHCFLKLLQAARCFKVIREDTRFYAALPLPVMRQTFLEMGRRLVETGALSVSEDIFHLTFSELETVNGVWPPSTALTEKLRTAVVRRKGRRAVLENIPLIDPSLFRKVQYEGEALVSGSPAGRGVAEGPVRIIRRTSEFSQLRQGEILVAPYTNPAWTPLFQRAAAVVVDAGGAASHAAIVAREYGIPAVMGTSDGTQRLRNGQMVRVDGNQGKVFHTR